MSPNLSNELVHTFELISDGIADNLTNNIVILNELKKKGRIRPARGGLFIRENILYQDNDTYTRYSGWDKINISPRDGITAAQYTYKMAAVSIAINGLEQLQNTGKPELEDLLTSRATTAEATFLNNMAIDAYSDGTADGARQITGLQSIIADSGVGTVGNIDSSTDPFWQNYVFDASTDGGAAVTSANIQGYISQILVNLKRNADETDFMLTDNNYWNAYHDSLLAIRRITSDSGEKYGTGAKALEYAGLPIYLDGGKGGACPANHMYFVNADHLHWRPHSGRNYTQIGSERVSLNQDGMIRLIGWAGNMTCSNRSLQGVLKD